MTALSTFCPHRRPDWLQFSPIFADLPRLSAKRTRMWRHVENRLNLLILLILLGKNWRRGPGSNRRIKVLQTFIEEDQTPVFMRLVLVQHLISVRLWSDPLLFS